MSEIRLPYPPFVTSVFHPSDLSEGSASAFAHALAIALRRQARFTMFHVVPEDRAVDVWTGFPAVRETLERWGMLEEDSPRSAVFEKLGVSVKKVNARGGSVYSAVMRFLNKEPSDLIVVATEGREGVPRWMQGSTAEKLARSTKSLTLFVPKGADGLVSLDDGSVTLRRILVPVDHEPDPGEAVAYAVRAAGMAGHTVEIALLYVGDAANAPEIELPGEDYCTFTRLERQGNVVETILHAAEEWGANLIVMGTQGHDGILDALRGSVTEQVLRRSQRPLLAVPLGSL